MVANYVIIENTPGYLPDDDDPPTFDSYAEALRELVDYNKRIYNETVDEDDSRRYGFVSPIVDGCFMYSETATDLGRVVTITALDDLN